MNYTARILTSESGRFILDEAGIVQRFEPSEDNPLTEVYEGATHHAIDTLVVPRGVRGFCDGFMRDVQVKSRFDLPDGLVSIGGTRAFPGCVFADCELPLVIIPESVREIGTFAFGHARIDTLQMPMVRCEYARQFKEARIGTLRLPGILRNAVALRGSDLQLDGELPDDDDSELGWLRSLCCNDTQIGKLEFY